MPPRNVIELARYQQQRSAGRAQAFSTRLCRHCGAALADGENEDDCSTALVAVNQSGAPLKLRAE